LKLQRIFLKGEICYSTFKINLDSFIKFKKEADMISPETIEANRVHLESVKKRLKGVLDNFDKKNNISEPAKEFGEKGNAYNQKWVANEGNKATNKLLEDTEAALRRIQEGSYGVCVDCLKEINVDRLVARPEASRCVGCQTAKGLHVR